jgi:integrase
VATSRNLLANGAVRWLFVTDLPPGVDGRRRQMKRRGFRDETAARAAESVARGVYGGIALTADGTVRAELADWLAERELDLEETTLSNYRDIVRCYIEPHLGDRQLYTVDRHVIHSFYKKLLACGRRDGGPLSPTSVRTVHRVLMKALRDIGMSVEGVRQPRPAQREAMGRKGVWTPAQSSSFLRHHHASRLRAAWALAIVLGMRRGELAGLKWSRVDLDRGVVFVHWQRTTSSGAVIEKAPKGQEQASRRDRAGGRR